MSEVRLIDAEALKQALHNFFDGKVIDEPTYILRDVFCYIDNAPTVERPQGEWIPVSERLPDKNGECLVSLDFGDVNIDAFVDGIFVCYLGNVIAWQPLPEPYKTANSAK